MHDNPDDGYSWPTCAAGPDDGPRSHRLWAEELDRLVCRPCEDKAAKWLTELPALFGRLNTTGALMRGASRGGGTTSGSKTPPIPPRLEVLSLVGPGGIAARLRDIEDAWRTALGWTVAPWRGSPAQAVPEHIKFLTNNLPWACDAYDSVGQDVDELRRLHAECTAADLNERRPGRVAIGRCPARFDDGALCGADLFASAASHRVRCGNCGSRWETLNDWRLLRQAQETVLATDAGVAA